MNLAELQAQHRFHVHQKVTMMVNRYYVYVDDGAGEPGGLVAFVQQKRMTFKEQVTFYTDESKQGVLFDFLARKVVDLASAYDVSTPDCSSIGVFGKKFGKSLLRSTWQMQQDGLEPVTVHERTMAMALFRRIWDFLPYIGDLPFPWKYHFDLLRADGSIVGAVDKTTRFRDHYVVRLDEDKLDRRLVLAQAVALDALQSR